MTAWLYLLLAPGLVDVVWNIWTIVRAPGHGPNYLQLTWSLLVVALPISMLVPSTTRVLMLIIASATLTGVAVNLWNAAQAPGDWGELFRGSAAAPIPRGCVARQPMVRPRQA